MTAVKNRAKLNGCGGTDVAVTMIYAVLQFSIETATLIGECSWKSNSQPKELSLRRTYIKLNGENLSSL